MRLPAMVIALTLITSACGNDAGTETSSDPTELTTTVPAPSSVAVTTTTAPAAFSSIVLCEDIELPVPNVIGTLPGGQNIDHELIGVISTYIAEHSDTYAGRWIDRDYGGTFVIAFTDDPAPHLEELLARRPQESDIAAIEPRPPITATWTVADSGYAVDVVQLLHTEAELRAVQDDIAALFDVEDFAWQGIGSGAMVNRVQIGLIRPTVADLDRLAPLVPVDMVCVEGPLWDESMALPSVDEPLSVMADAETDPLVHCGSAPFRLSILDQPADVLPDTEDPAEIVLLAGGVEGFPVPQTGWRTLSRTEDEAHFGHFSDGSSTLQHSLRNTPTGWTLGGTSAGGACILRLAAPDGVSIMRLGLDPENPVDADSTTVHLLVQERGCAGSADPTERIRPPEVIETPADIRIAIAVVPLEGSQTCPGNPSVPVTIELTAPLGNRVLLDGIHVPPIPLGDLDL